ncbi:MAG: N-acetylgalactosamine 6-sulfate sulfatase, partial [bacterium]|nr:N-acetylgalactosamine 6-sulfate sulfatase [bacterium]
WKLHRIEQKGKVKFELYNLIDDPMEAADQSGNETKRVEQMAKSLNAWQLSVLDSWSGKDYAK